tara:strand:- start:252 stop:806 length:555 start_codon:yes stop_codon:yes gene_type:complete
LIVEEDSFGGKFLIALPSLQGDFFQHTITLVIDHSDSGAFGLVINKTADLNLSDLVSTDFNLPPAQLPVLLGGPVEQDHLYFLHSTEKSYTDSYCINGDVTLTTSAELLDDLSREQAPENMMALMGYAGWAAGQLESEVSRDAWLIAPFEKDVLFSTPLAERPVIAARNMGVDLNLIIGDTRQH